MNIFPLSVILVPEKYILKTYRTKLAHIPLQTEVGNAQLVDAVRFYFMQIYLNELEHFMHA